MEIKIVRNNGDALYMSVLAETVLDYKKAYTMDYLFMYIHVRNCADFMDIVWETLAKLSRGMANSDEWDIESLDAEIHKHRRFRVGDRLFSYWYNNRGIICSNV
jgi:hypothetical protein